MELRQDDQHAVHVDPAYLQLESILADILGENEYLRNNQQIGVKAVQLLQRKTNAKERDAERKLTALTISQQKQERELANQLISQDFQISKLKLECIHQKRHCAVLQLKLESKDEDLQQCKKGNGILSKELSTSCENLRASQAKCTSLQADLTEIYQQLENHKVATCKAETQAANALSSLGKNKAEFQGELNQAHEQIATLEQGLSTSEKLLQDRSQDFQELQTRFASEKERWNAEYNALQTAAAKAETIAQERLSAANDKAQANLDHHKELYAVQRSERDAAEALWNARFGDLQTQIEQLQKQNASLCRQVAQQGADLERSKAAQMQIPGKADEADEAMCGIADLVDHLYHPSPEPSPEKAAKPKAKASPLKANLGVQKIITAPKQNQKKAAGKKPSKPKPGAYDPYALEACPEEQAQIAQKTKSLKSTDDPTSQNKCSQPSDSQEGSQKKDLKADHQDQTDQQKMQSSADVQAVGNERPKRNRRQTQPFWLATSTTNFSPATLSPTPSAPDSDDTNDPSFTIGNPNPAEERQKDVHALPHQKAEDKEIEEWVAPRKSDLDDTAMLPSFQDTEAAQPAVSKQTSLMEPGFDKSEAVKDPIVKPAAQKRPLGRGQGKAGGKKSRLGPKPSEVQNVQPEPSEKPLQPPNEQDFDESKTQTEANVPEKELTEVAGNKGTQGEAEGSQEAGPTRKSGRPIGISKIDLRTVWGSRTPMVDPNDATPMADVPAPELANQAQQDTVAAQNSVNVESSSIANGRTEAGSALEADPLAALHPGVIQAAKGRQNVPKGKPKPSNAAMPPPPPPGMRRSQLAKPANYKQAPNKRVLQPSTYLSEDATRDLLLGGPGGFKVPRLKKPDNRA